MTTHVRITHTAETGTRFEGEADPALLKDAGFMRGRSGWLVRGSRDTVLTAPRRRRLEDLAASFRDIGLTVEVEIDNTPRPAQERYDASEERAEDRRAGLTAAATRRDRAAHAAWERSNDLVAGREPGQPILAGHHSQKGDERRLARSAAAMDRSVALAREADDLASRATRVATHTKDSLGTILRRIAKLEGEVAVLDRYEPYETKPGSDVAWQDWHRNQRIQKRDDLALWKRIRDERVADGARLWGPGDFKKGERVNVGGHWGTVEKINPKSLGVRTDVMPQFVDRFPYDKVLAKGPTDAG